MHQRRSGTVSEYLKRQERSLLAECLKVFSVVFGDRPHRVLERKGGRTLQPPVEPTRLPDGRGRLRSFSRFRYCLHRLVSAQRQP